MEMVRFTIMGLVMVSSLVHFASAISGTATFYNVYVPSSCYGFENRGVMIAAANSALFNNRAACGSRYRVRCSGATNLGVPQPCRNGAEVIVTIVDLCPGCTTNQLDLSQEAFSMIANLDAGRIQIEYFPV